MDIQFTNIRQYPKIGLTGMKFEVWADGDKVGEFRSRDGKRWEADSDLCDACMGDPSASTVEEAQERARAMLEG